MKTVITMVYTLNKDVLIGDVLHLTLDNHQFETTIKFHINKSGNIKEIIIYRYITSSFIVISKAMFYIVYKEYFKLPSNLINAHKINDLTKSIIQSSKDKFDKL